MNLQDFLDSGIAVCRSTSRKYKVTEIDKDNGFIRIRKRFVLARRHMPYIELHPGDIIRMKEVCFYHDCMFKAGEEYKITRVDDNPEVQRIYILEKIHIPGYYFEPLGKPKMREKAKLI